MQSEQGRFAVKVPGVIESPEDVLSLPMKVDGERVVHFRDIAEVRRTFKDPESYARLNGEPAVGIRVVQRSGANMLNTVDAIKVAVADAQKNWPPGISLTYSRDKTVFVREDISQLVNDVVVAVLLVVICLIGILGLQNALLAGISIPGLVRCGLRAARRDRHDHEHGRVLRPHHVRWAGGGRRHRGGRAGGPAHG